MSHASLIQQACFLEATARKPGNVHPEARFVDVCWADFVRSAEVVAPILADAPKLGVGRAILEAVTATHSAIGFNTNLGIVLLLAPLAAVPDGRGLRLGIAEVLSSLTNDDAIATYAAIRLAQPGGLGRAESEDVATIPKVTLREAMTLAADRDQIAAQYATNFERVFRFADWFKNRLMFSSGNEAGFTSAERDASAVSALLTQAGSRLSVDVEHAIIHLQLAMLADAPDSLIARKCSLEAAQEASRWAGEVLGRGWPKETAGVLKLSEFDDWLRTNRHNPGTTADFVVACQYVVLREFEPAS